MKKLITICAALLVAVSVFAQAPEKMSYQAVIRNNANALVANTAVGMKISILQGSANGAVVYAETQTPSTNANGLVSLEIGTGAVVSGTFATINWASGLYFIKTETDPTGGTNYTITGTSQLMSVPYALYAKTSGSGASLQLFATYTLTSSIRPFAYSRYTFPFNNKVSGANQDAWTNNTTYTVPTGLGGLYNINLAMIANSIGTFTSFHPYPEIQITRGATISYYYGTSNGSTILSGNGTDETSVVAAQANQSPVTISRGILDITLPLQAGDIVKVFFRPSSSSTATTAIVTFSTDGSSYLSITKLN